jgi:2-iminobutanoate/2-iminopropanoate deaminase
VSTHERRAVSTGKAPRAIGPYSQAIVAGGFVFCSGMIALDPTSGEMVGAADVAAQARRAPDSPKAPLEAAGSSMDRDAKTTIYLTDLGDFATVNEIYAGYFGAPPPARATVQVAGLPRGAMVEIDAIALVSASP